MPIYQLEDIPEEFVTPKHSTAFGRLITGAQVEVGLLRYKAGEGAKQHAHPHEQVLLVLSGRCRLTLDGEPTIIGSGMAALIPPNTPHALDVLEDAEVVSCKGVIGGVGHRILSCRPNSLAIRRKDDPQVVEDVICNTVALVWTCNPPFTSRRAVPRTHGPQTLGCA